MQMVAGSLIRVDVAPLTASATPRPSPKSECSPYKSAKPDHVARRVEPLLECAVFWLLTNPLLGIY
jgi:hypothetical protein